MQKSRFKAFFFCCKRLSKSFNTIILISTAINFFYLFDFSKLIKDTSTVSPCFTYSKQVAASLIISIISQTISLLSESIHILNGIYCFSIFSLYFSHIFNYLLTYFLLLLLNTSFYFFKKNLHH